VPPRSAALRAGGSSRTGRRTLLAGLVTGLLSSLSSLASAESEAQVKAAFLFNFARYVEWPPAAFGSETAEIRLCVIGESDFQQVVSESVSGRSVGQRPVAVEKVEDLDAAEACHLLFLGAGVVWPPSVVADRLGGHAVFTISDQPGFAADGGVANFILVDQKIRFEINPSAARRAGLKISSSLLRLAKLVGVGGH
jgi:hypothetical protein